MKHTRRVFVSVLAMASTFALGPSFGMSLDNLPQEERQGSVTYLTGGVGQKEIAAMRHAESKYPLSLEFVQRFQGNDVFVPDVFVVIKDHAGKIALQDISDGPLLLAKLPDGDYTVMAEENGKTESRQVVVAANKPEHLVFEWR